MAPALVPAGSPDEAAAADVASPVKNPLDLEATLSTCRWCWGRHPGVCPFIKVVEWHENGHVARVVLKERTRHEDVIVYPDDADNEDQETAKT